MAQLLINFAVTVVVNTVSGHGRRRYADLKRETFHIYFQVYYLRIIILYFCLGIKLTCTEKYKKNV